MYHEALQTLVTWFLKQTNISMPAKSMFFFAGICLISLSLYIIDTHANNDMPLSYTVLANTAKGVFCYCKADSIIQRKRLKHLRRMFGGCSTEPGLSTTMAVEAKQLSSVTLLIFGMVDSCEE